MRRITLGKNGPDVSSLGLGCMRMSMPGRTDIDENEGIATIHAALDAGITFLNTGDFYGHGHNEMLVGRALRDRRDEAFVSVKFGAMFGPPMQMDCRPAAVKNFAEYSLQRLGIDTIDLYQPARLDPDVPIEDTVGAIAELIQAGKVRHLGLSEMPAEVIRRAHAVHPVAAVEVEYSLATRFPETEMLPTLRELGITMVAYGASSHGLLSGTVTGPPDPNSFDAVWPRLQGERLDANLAAVEPLRKLAADKGVTMAQLAIAWVASQADDILTLVGMSKRSRLPENLAAFELELTDADRALLDEAFPVGTFAGERYPTELIPGADAVTVTV